jgi:hypothetical protein
MAKQDDLIAEGVGVVFETAAVLMGHDLMAPAAGFGGAAVAQYLLGRFQRGSAIAQSEFQRANATADDFRDREQLSAAAWGYMRAARNQAADENLRILAQAMIGCARRQELWANDFLRYADMLAPLSRDELILIGRMMADEQKFNSSPRPPDSGLTLWNITANSLVKEPPSRGIFPSVAYLSTIATRATRSGLIYPITTVTGIAAELSPIGREVRNLINIDAALKEHQGARP